jgi:hypothetical protein
MRSELGKKSLVLGEQIVLGVLYSFLPLGGWQRGLQSAHATTDGTASQRTARRSRVSLAAQRTGPTTDGTGWGWRGLALEPPGICARGRGRMDHGWGSRPGPGRMGRWCWAEKRADGAFFPFVRPNLMSVKKFSGQILGYFWPYLDYL